MPLLLCLPETGMSGEKASSQETRTEVTMLEMAQRAPLSRHHATCNMQHAAYCTTSNAPQKKQHARRNMHCLVLQTAVVKGPFEQSHGRHNMQHRTCNVACGMHHPMQQATCLIPHNVQLATPNMTTTTVTWTSFPRCSARLQGVRTYMKLSHRCETACTASRCRIFSLEIQNQTRRTLG